MKSLIEGFEGIILSYKNIEKIIKEAIKKNT
jgi:hypothetical protein